jgi:hypothetical protein
VTSSKAGGDRSYKRSWKNLLINKRYQLRFTLFMVGLTSLLMVGLGIWVMRVANETTEVSMASVRGNACPPVPSIGDVAPAAADDEPASAPSMKLDDPDAPAGSAGPAAVAPAAVPPAAVPPAAAGEPRHVKVQLDESSMTVPVPPDFAEKTMKHWVCELQQIGKMDRLEHGRIRILWAMILTGILLVFGLAVYGIKMTHRVAGPLFKVSLYLSKMRAGRFDKVYNLRKGDQLIEFYDHFKLAHGGVVTMQRDDITRIAAVIAAADAAGEANHPAVVALREMLARKEKSIE